MSGNGLPPFVQPAHGLRIANPDDDVDGQHQHQHHHHHHHNDLLELDHHHQSLPDQYRQQPPLSPSLVQQPGQNLHLHYQQAQLQHGERPQPALSPATRSLASPQSSETSSLVSCAVPIALPSSYALQSPVEARPRTLSQPSDSDNLDAYSSSNSRQSSFAPNSPPGPSGLYHNSSYDSHSRFRKLHHRQSMPLTYQGQQQVQYSNSSRPRNLPHSNSFNRPLSGIYYHPNMSSSTGHTPESSYQRARAESGQSANGLVREARATTTSTVHPSMSTRETRAERSHRQTSQSGLPNGVPFSQRPPGRMAGGPDPGYSSSNPAQLSGSPYGSSNPGLPSGSPYGSSIPGQLSGSPYSLEGGPMASSEEWKEKGAAVSVRKEIDAEGKPVTRTVKKGVKDFRFGRTLGEGSYSTVLAATDRQTSKEYAIKVLDKKHIIKEKKVKYVNIEKDTLNRLTDHPGIVRLYYTFQDERSLYFVLDLAIGGELLGVLKRTTSFDEECTRFYGAQILDAIVYMHQRGIIHRDLKPENVLLDDQMHVKITDFGTAKILDLPSQFGKVSVSNNPMDGAETDRAHSFVGTAEYVSPELLTDKNACKASDLWAFGCIIYQLLAGRPPFKAGNEYQTFQKIVALDYSFPEGFPLVARDLIEKLLILDPSKRLAVDKIKSHPFFDGIQWGKGLWKQQAPRLKPYVASPKDTSAPLVNQMESMAVAIPPKKPPMKSNFSSSNAGGASQSRSTPRIITALAPPSQLDIAWSAVLTKNNERILKLGNLVVYSSPAPHSPTSRNQSTDTPADTSSKLSRFFGTSNTKKRQRLVMITSAGRIVIAPAGGDKKEAKMVISLLDMDVSCKSLMDAKGYTVWCVFTRDKNLTFEDPKANTGDSGSSVRNTQEWLECIESAKNFASAQSPQTAYATDGTFDDLNPLRSSPGSPNADAGLGLASGYPPPSRNILRKNHDTDGDSLKGRKRFSKRHSKNGLAAVF